MRIHALASTRRLHRVLRALLAALAMRRGFFGASPRSSVTAAEPLSEAETAAQEAALDAPKNRRRLPKKARALRAAAFAASAQCPSVRYSPQPAALMPARCLS